VATAEVTTGGGDDASSPSSGTPTYTNDDIDVVRSHFDDLGERATIFPMEPEVFKS